MDHLKKTRQPPPTVIEDKSFRSHVKKYKVCGHLGKGGFANVYRVQSIDSNKIYACKVINKSKLVHNEHKRKLVSEIKLHQSLNHKTIVKFERHFEDKKNVYILLQCCPNKSLMELSFRRKRLTESEVRFFMLQLLIGIRHLHSKFIIHRDLKLGNILLDQNLNIKLCDFGLAAKLDFDEQRKTTICGTPNYTAPEILNQRKSGLGHSYEVDIWSVAVIMFTLLTGKPPFETKNIKETYRRIKRIKYEFPLDSDRYISAQARQLIGKIFTKEPTKRPNLLQIRNHSFFTELPIPKALPMCVLKRAPTKQELFPDTKNKENNKENINVSNAKPSQSSRPLLLSKGFKTKSNFANNYLYSKRKYTFESKANDTSYSEDDDIKNMITKNTLHLERESKTKEITIQKSAKRSKMQIMNEDFLSIIKYVDYTKKYGLGYILSNGATGIYFNDATKILLLRNKRDVIYVSAQESKQQCSMTNYPNCLKKKLTLLKHFTDYLWKCDGSVSDDSKKADETEAINKQLTALKLSVSNPKSNSSFDNVYLKAFVTDHYCELFKLSNNMVQVNFADKSQIKIRDKFVLYKDKLGRASVYHLNDIYTTNKKDLKKRCKYTQQLLSKIGSSSSSRNRSANSSSSATTKTPQTAN